MTWVEKRVAKCDECGYEWIPEVENPSQCPSRKCRKRTWNRKQEFQDFVSTSPVAEADARELVPVITAKPQEKPEPARTRKAPKEPEGRVVGSEKPEIEYHEIGLADDDIDSLMAEPEVEMCAYKEYDSEVGEWFGCRLPVHGPKVKHQRGEKL